MAASVSRMEVQSSIQPDLTSLIRVRLQGHYVNLLVDSGASRSVIDWEFAKSLGANIQCLQPGEVAPLQTASKNLFEIVGKCRLSIATDTNRIFNTFIVINNLSLSCLVGMEFLRVYKVQPNYETGKIKIDGLDQINFVRSSDFLGYIRLAQRVRLMPNRTFVAQVHISGGKAATTGILKPLSFPLPGVEILGLDFDNTHRQKFTIKLFNYRKSILNLRSHGPIALMIRDKSVAASGSPRQRDDDSVGGSHSALQDVGASSGRGRSQLGTGLDAEGLVNKEDTKHEIILNSRMSGLSQTQKSFADTCTSTNSEFVNIDASNSEPCSITSSAHAALVFSRSCQIDKCTGTDDTLFLNSDSNTVLSTVVLAHAFTDVSIQCDVVDCTRDNTVIVSTDSKAFVDKCTGDNMIFVNNYDINNCKVNGSLTSPRYSTGHGLQTRDAKITPSNSASISQTCTGEDEVIVTDINGNKNNNDDMCNDEIDETVILPGADLQQSCTNLLHFTAGVGAPFHGPTDDLTRLKPFAIHFSDPLAVVESGQKIISDAKVKEQLVLDKNPKDRTFLDLDIVIKNETLSDNDIQPFRTLMEENSDLFALTQKEIGKFNLYEIDLQPKIENPPPIRCKVYPQSLEAKKEIERQVTELLEAGLIQESTSPYAVPCFLVKKADGSQRFVYDMKRVNTLLKDETYLSPTIQDCLEKISDMNGRYFIKLDLKSAFNHLVLSQKSRIFSAFKCSLGTFEWTRVLFGGKNSPSAMIKAINMVLSKDPLLISNTICYVDDILIFASNH